MSQPRTVAVVVGSLRKDSVTRKVARAIEALAPAHLKFEEISIGDLPLYDQDDEASPPGRPRLYSGVANSTASAARILSRKAR